MGTAQEKTKTLAEIIASFNAERVQGMASLFAEQEKESRKESATAPCTVDTTRKLAEYERSLADRHRKARQEFKVIIPEHKPSAIEIRQRLTVINGGGKACAGIRAAKRRQGFKVFVNHRSDLAIEVVNDMVELGLL